MLVFTVSIVTNNSLEIDYSQGHYIKISSIMHGTHFLPFTLEAHGLVTRIQYSEIPPHVEYGLTQAGLKLVPALQELKKWGEEQAILERQLQSSEK